MILLDEVYSLFEWLAEQNTYIQHNPTGTPLQRRFARYKSEALTGQHSTLGSPRLEVCELPYGDLTDGLGWERDRAVFELRVIYNVEKYKVTETTTALDNAKKALIELLNYLFSAQQECTDCNQLLCLFNLSTVKYSWLDKATLGGNWVGCRATFELRRNIDWETVTYGPRPDYTTTAFNTWLHGNGVPANTLGIDGDFYIVDDDTDAPYYRKVSGAWVFQRNLVGAGSITETDPVFTASAAAGITNTNITNWNTAYGWGSHASAGYLTTETDPVFSASPAAGIETSDITNWNTAHGWGNHASAGYLTSAPVSSVNSQTGAVVLTTTHIAEGTNLYYTDARAIAQVTATNFSGTLPLSKGGTGTTTGLPINNLIAATGAATLNHAANAQEWQWNSLAGGTGFKLSAATTAAASNTQKLFDIALSGANATSGQTTYGMCVINSHTGTSSTNIAGYFSASGGTNNYGLIVADGGVGIGTATPNSSFRLQIGGGSGGYGSGAELININSAVNRAAGVYYSQNSTIKGILGLCGLANEFVTGTTLGDFVIRNSSNIYFTTDGGTTINMALSSAGRLGVGVSAPTAVLHLKAGTATANTAPLKFASGTNLTTAEAGAMEYNGTNIFFTRTGTTRENIVCASAVNSVSPTSPNRTITVNINGTTYYLHAKTTND